MNPQMKKLADEARFTDQVPYPSEDEVFQKFGELLVKECMHLCVLEQADPRDTIEMSCALRIKKHFGVDYE